MNTDKLVQMANQIADFFGSYPEPEATAGIRQHIKAFWTPRMREALLADRTNAGLHPLVIKALAAWPQRTDATPTPAPAPAG
jgi:formate dehydrogenase subunit delta